MSQKKFCPHCGRKLPPNLNNSERNFCIFCGYKLKEKRVKKACTICHNPIFERNKTTRCSFCESMYHSSCVSSWLLKHNACPMCQNVFIFPDQTDNEGKDKLKKKW